ncbi:MAG TPA: serine hydrolase domain-containing protein, partial [Gemmatimonadaceae bacterium]|nr:serine hydrolase domain-containing protein [Gemmatimonadaceae bacterium]
VYKFARPSPSHRLMPTLPPRPASARRAPLLLAGLGLAALALPVRTAHAQNGGRAALSAAVDSIANAFLAGGKGAGLSVAVVKGRDTLALTGYGKADLELDTPTPPRAVYEIGSVTKQFTSVALLMLRDEGKLALDDDFTKYLPDYPTQGRRITVRQLLNHTSGIKGYTEMPQFGPMMVRDLPKDSLVALFAKEPFNFEPGEREVYNNSAFFLAGLIVEKLSGKSYADFVQERIFDKVGMKDSHYCSESRIIKGKVKGYDMGPKGLQKQGFLRHTYPYAAGSLCSSAADLLAWNRALHGGKVLPAASYQELIAPQSLKDGTKLRYGLGITMHDVNGHRVIEHGGGINGFLSASDYFPDEDAVIVVLSNSTGLPPDAIVAAIADRVFGKKARPSQPYGGSLAELAGTYAGVGRGMDLTMKIAPDGNRLMATVMAGPDPKPGELRYLGNDTWEREGQRLTFARTDGKVTQLRVDMVYGYSILDRKP